MSKNQELSERAKGIAQDLSSLEQRYNTYVNATNGVVKAGVFKQEEVLSRNHDSILSVIEGLGAPQFRDHLSSDQKEQLVQTVKSTSNAMMALTESENDREKLALSTAKVEASLKGFELPTSMGGPMMELDWHGIPNDDLDKLFDITKQSLLEASTQNIPADKFAKKVTSLIKAKIPDVFAPDQVENVGKIVDQGVKSNKRAKLKPHELAHLDNLAPNIANNLTQILDRNKQEALGKTAESNKTQSLEKASKNYIQKLDNSRQEIKFESAKQNVIDETIQSLEGQGYKMSKAKRHKLENALNSTLSDSLKGHDVALITQNKEAIAQDLSKQMTANNPFLYKIFSRISLNEKKMQQLSLPQEYLSAINKTNQVTPKASNTQDTPAYQAAKNRAPAPQPPSQSKGQPSQPLPRNTNQEKPPVPYLPPVANNQALTSQPKEQPPQRPERSKSPTRPARPPRNKQKSHADSINAQREAAANDERKR